MLAGKVRRAAVAAVAASTLVAVMGAAAEAAPAAAPQVRIASLSPAPASVSPGDRISVAYRVTRRRAGVRRARLRVYLSPSRRLARGAVRLAGGRSLGALRRRRSLRGRVQVEVPPSTPARRYRLLACVEQAKRPARRVCRAARGAIGVRAPAPQPPPRPGPPQPPPGGTPKPPTTSPPGGTRDPAKHLATPDPLAVKPALDAARTAEGTIGAAGGTLVAFGADGTTFTLTIPPGALLAETRISMTPLTGVGDLPFDGLVAGVDLQPEGLRFFEPVTLAFAPPAGVPLQRQAPFVYSGGGRDFRAHPLVPDPSKLEMPLMHFTGAGIADGSAAQQAAQQQRAPANHEAQWEQRTADLIDRWREESFDLEAFEALGRDYYEAVVAPRLEVAKTNDEFGEVAITTFLAWERHFQLLGFEQDELLPAERAAGWAAIPVILRNAYDKSFAHCVGGEISAVQRMIGIARSAQLLGIDLGANEFERLDRCLRFELDYNLWAARDLYSGSDFVEGGELEVRASGAPLRLQGPAFALQGTLPLSVVGWRWEDQVCEVPGGTATPVRDAAATLEVEPGNPIEQRRLDGSVKTTFPPPTIHWLDLDPGDVETRDGCGGDAKAGGFHRNATETTLAHLEGAPGLLRLRPWSFLGADPWAIFHDGGVAGSVGDLWVADLTLALRHTPAP